MRDGSYVSPSKVTVKGFLDSWILKHQSKLATSTAKRYKSMIRRVNDEIGKHYIQRLTPDHIEDMYTTLGREDTEYAY